MPSRVAYSLLSPQVSVRGWLAVRPVQSPPRACEVVSGIQYTYAQPAQRTRQRGKALYLQRDSGNACAGFKGFEER